MRLLSFVAAVLVVALLAVVCQLPGLGPHSPSAPLSSALPQALSCKAHPMPLAASAVGGPPRPASRAGMDEERAAQQSWAAASLASERKAALRPAPILGQLLQWGGYVTGTDPSDLRLILVAVRAAARDNSALLLLATAMIAAIVAVARRTDEAESQPEVRALAKAPTPWGGSRLHSLKPQDSSKYPLARRAPKVLVGDRVADWERVLLVPT